MTKNFFVTTGAFVIALAMVSGLSSCQDEDLGVSETVLKERAFERGFVKEFGQPAADQRWDFYAQMMEKRDAALASKEEEEGITRASSSDFTFTALSEQPAFIEKADLLGYLHSTFPEGENNSSKGTRDYTMSYGGEFTISAIYYGNEQETYNNFEFGFGTYPDTLLGWIRWFINFLLGSYYFDRFPLFYESSSANINPGTAYNVRMRNINVFDLYIRVPRTRTGSASDYYYSAASQSMILKDDSFTYYDEATNSNITTYYRMIGFEDNWSSSSDRDFNDVVVVVSTTTQEILPSPISARYFCEDKESLDWDFNDVVFDVSNTGITIYAVGGTLPVKIKYTVANQTQTTDELHELMGVGKIEGTEFYKPVNVNASNGVDHVNPVKLNFTDRIDNDQVQAFKPTLIVDGSTFSAVDSNVNTEVQYNPSGSIPSIIQVPFGTLWMKELQKISKGFPTFYTGEEWYKVNVQTDYLVN